MIQLNNISFSFKKGEPLFNDLNWSLQPGKTYGLLGLNGAGKTSLFNIISGMLFPKDGECTFDGNVVRNRNPQFLSELFLVPEQFELPAMSGDQYTQLHAPFYPRFDEQLMERSLSELQVNSKKKISELSFGQQKKYLLSFALATRTKLLLLDEPTNGMDIPSKSQFRKLQASLDQPDRCTVISTHQVRDLGSMIDHVTILKDGKIIFNHSLDEIFERLSFIKTESDQSDKFIYSEEVLGGLHTIQPFKEGARNEFDLELLFNGVIQQPEQVNKQFNGVEK
ncbi:MAG: ABC transporter ATP-binding protein [Rhodohalobacter sp.]|uniref:ABC transporter ATP-binding protein n=2 Tax=Rhodohalobacter sp. TaxID=1974210 RepID=UPI0039750955